MFRSTSLSQSHYAGKWIIPNEDNRNDLGAISVIGREYALSPDSPEKEGYLLTLLEAFHSYMSKYLVMIVRGTIPNGNSDAGVESRELLRQIKPKGKVSTSASTCKMLHLAFKGATTEDIYDTLAFCFVRAARKFDPHHAEKVKAVCKVIDELPKKFTIAELAERVDGDAVGILRALSRKSFLTRTKSKKVVVGYEKSFWPPPAEFLEIDPIGFTYVIQMWFRYYLNDYIGTQMDELESVGGGVNLLLSSTTSFSK